MFVANRALEHIAVADLRPAKRNVRTHSKKQIRQISRSIDKVGFTNPLIIDEQNGVLAGHGRLAAAKEMGLVEVPCIRLSDVSEADRRTYAIADNQIALNAGYDYEILACELTELIDLQIDTSLTGFEQAQIDAILVSATESSPKSSGPEDFFPPLPAPGSVVTQPGDHWVLGRHRLVCGDAKSPEDVSTLMQWDKADMAFLDPPYNVPIAGHVSGLGRTQHREFSEAVGEKSSAEFTDFLETSFANVERACRNGAIVYACMDWRHVGEISAAGNAAFTEHKNICVWAKTNGGMGTFLSIPARAHFRLEGRRPAAHEQLRAWRQRKVSHQRLVISRRERFRRRSNGGVVFSSDGKAGCPSS